METWEFAYPFSLQQVPALVPPHDLQACSDGETQQRNEGIRKSNAIDVVGAGPADQIPGDIVAPEKQVEDGGIDLRGRCNFPGARARLPPDDGSIYVLMNHRPNHPGVMPWTGDGDRSSSAWAIAGK